MTTKKNNELTKNPAGTKQLVKQPPIHAVICCCSIPAVLFAIVSADDVSLNFFFVHIFNSRRRGSRAQHNTNIIITKSKYLICIQH